MGESVPLVIGIDEAGRGPIIGDLVIALVAINKGSLEKLRNIGIRDSKELTPRQREKFVPLIIRLSTNVLVTYISPSEIDRYNLNELIVKRIAYLLNSLTYLINPCNIERIVIDMVGGYRRYLNFFIEDIREKLEFRVDADQDFIEVGAASIVAKHYRDLLIRELNNLYGELGSGYPTDPRTRRWVTEQYSRGINPPPFVRRSWGILKRIAPGWYINKKTAKKKQRTLLDYF